MWCAVALPYLVTTPRPYKPVWAPWHAYNVCTHHYPNFGQQQLPVYASVLGGHSVCEKHLTPLPIFLMAVKPMGFQQALSYAQHQIHIPSAVWGGKLKCCYGHSHSTV